MGREEIADRIRTVLRPVATVSAGAALVLLVWAALLGLWSRLVSPRSMAEQDWYPTGLHRWGESLPNGLAIATTGVALVLLGAIAYSIRRGRTDGYRPAAPAVWAAVLALLFFAFFTRGIPEYYSVVMGNYPVTTALPFGVTAWFLSVAGAVATLLGASAFWRLRREHVRLVAVGAVIAVVAAAGVTVGALRSGDDGRFVDATRAPGAPGDSAPAFPGELGTRSFTVSVPDAFTDNPAQPVYSIAPGGQGFVVYHAGRVTAYGADGAERWHYNRTGPGGVSVAGMRVFDDGQTVVMFVDDALVALDATTGEQLWSSMDPGLVYAVSQQSGFNLDSPFAIVREAAAWTRYDTRTGTRMWTVPVPDERCEYPPREADTRNWVVTVSRCRSGEDVGIRVYVLDPETGQIRSDREIMRGGEDLMAIATPANDDGIFMQFAGAGAPASALSAMSYVNVADDTVTALPEEFAGEPSFGPSGAFLATGPRGREVTRFGVDGRRLCTVTDDVRGARTEVPGEGRGLAYASFDSGFVIADRLGGLRTFDATCAQTGGIPEAAADIATDVAVSGFLPVPGAVLVLRRDGSALQIDGYTAG
ncbi:hypothetical protein LI99_08205 [Mycolicibacterium smegmatis]|uniref:Pyrrolo-quinoline quinone repeat domain-containing protein n=1 Tax=Mycolicibacterium smegmatis (strain ATCC 700084 / mc(2)155) TaxID=246196 RepID=A0QSY2_MYCS2|nr:hypothetical protein MSMEG_1643 [Mycolicibacterium smegmatis MC2 155]AIU13498.1 hypothetical protein LI99_08205 [Mycolicibacterium smegmatis]AIU06873.1 hypothetical protein LJ00_08205 [Mycolicibacterium smegmatis MC2 155]AIU20122.1 hypothetical protein LI98_08205 [Mycolicibacterium smegmatis]MBE9620102.1 PQQ-binding-like beta-propeller repeat protein [Mycolicibacterium smegmatis]